MPFNSILLSNLHVLLYFFDILSFFVIGCIESNIDYNGKDLHVTKTNTSNECMQDCANNNLCHFWTFDKINNICYLKNRGAFDYRSIKDGVVSGTKFCPGNLWQIVKLLLKYLISNFIEYF